MATNNQRWTDHCNAVVNGVATDDQKLRLGRAYAWQARRLDEFDAATTADKLAFTVQAMREAELARVRAFEAALASNTAIDAVSAGFPEAP